MRLALLLPGVASLLAAVMGCFFVHRFDRLAADEAVAPTSYDLNRILGALVVTGSFALVGLGLVVLSLVVPKRKALTARHADARPE